MDLSEVEKLEQLDETGRLLLKAADLIEQRGLERQGYNGPNGELCVQAACYEALIEKRLEPGNARLPYGSSFFAALSRMSKKLNGEAPHVWIRNPDISKEMIVAKMREAARL